MRNMVAIAGHFNVKLWKNQTKWLSCEIEALSIASAIKHLSPYIIQLTQTAYYQTWVQALTSWVSEFSASLRMATFLSVILHYVSSASILPSDIASKPWLFIAIMSDLFICKTSDSVVYSISATEVLSNCKVVFHQSVWLDIQTNCPDLRRTCVHLCLGTRP